MADHTLYFSTYYLVQIPAGFSSGIVVSDVDLFQISQWGTHKFEFVHSNENIEYGMKYLSNMIIVHNSM